ncbi:hypothetical protein Gohar_007013 [Gossypium harknessii]|uniref:Autophagy-related protein 18a-like n=1 Tax=Gossypium harknessii TaxID=34285 RepID=A0A7J9GF71_9ROSI|nr:hypothetical protein [Gossypium harknessii]
MVWDDNQNRCIGELSFCSEMRSVRLRRDRIIETIANSKGLCVVSQGVGSLVLVCPRLQKGLVRIEHYAPKRSKFIMAHDSRIACFTLLQDGQLLATTSTKGTLGRRGVDKTKIYSLAFFLNAQWLAVSSDKGIVHVFGLKFNSGSPGSIRSQCASEPHHSSLSFIRGKVSPPVIRCCKRP